MSNVIVGDVVVAPRVQLKIGRFYDGEARVVARQGFSEVAYPGKTPTRFPQEVTIDGADAVATAARKSDIKGLSVVLVAWVPAG